MKICAYCHQEAEGGTCRGCGSELFMEDWELYAIRDRSKPEKKRLPWLVVVPTVVILSPLILAYYLFKVPFIVLDRNGLGDVMDYDPPWDNILVAFQILFICVYYSVLVFGVRYLVEGKFLEW